MTAKGHMIVDIKEFAKHPYTWPGMYPRFAIMSDGETLCHRCVKKYLGQIVDSTVKRYRDGWAVDAIDINWEERDLFCAHCSQAIESAYAS